MADAVRDMGRSGPPDDRSELQGDVMRCGHSKHRAEQLDIGFRSEFRHVAGESIWPSPTDRQAIHDVDGGDPILLTDIEGSLVPQASQWPDSEERCN